MRRRICELTARRWARLGAFAFGSVAIMVAGMLVGWRLAGPTSEETAIGRVSLEVVPSLGGEARGYVPIADWGFRADALVAPFTIEAELRTLDRRALLAAASGDEAVLKRARSELRDGARSAVARALAWGLVASLVLALLAAAAWPGPRRLRARLLLPASVAGLAVGFGIASATVAARSFDAGAFEQPTYFARGAELSQLLAVAERERERGSYASGFEQALASFSAFLTRTAPIGAPGVEIVLASDLHNNALVIEPLRRFIRRQPVLLAGDFGHDGNEREAELLAPKIARLSSRVLAVSGNHDSAGLMRSLQGAGVTVLVGSAPRSELERVVDVDGLSVAGFPDPLEWTGTDPGDPERIFSFSEFEGGTERLQAATEELIAWFERLPDRPDIVMVHQNALAQALAAELWAEGYDEPLTVVTGHDHLQHVDRYGSVVVVDAGSVGAGGVFGAGREFAGMAELHFDAQDATLRSVDFISVEPLSGQAQAERVVIDSVCPLGDEPADEACRYEPGEYAALG